MISWLHWFAYQPGVFDLAVFVAYRILILATIPLPYRKLFAGLFSCTIHRQKIIIFTRIASVYADFSCANKETFSHLPSVPCLLSVH